MDHRMLVFLMHQILLFFRHLLLVVDLSVVVVVLQQLFFLLILNLILDSGSQHLLIQKHLGTILLPLLTTRATTMTVSCTWRMKNLFVFFFLLMMMGIVILAVEEARVLDVTVAVVTSATTSGLATCVDGARRGQTSVVVVVGVVVAFAICLVPAELEKEIIRDYKE